MKKGMIEHRSARPLKPKPEAVPAISSNREGEVWPEPRIRGLGIAQTRSPDILLRMACEYVRIVADDRENAGGVIAQLQARPDVRLEIRRLGVGDFIVEERFAVERKTLVDFARSIIDGRLFKQAAALSRDGRRGILVLEGTGPTDQLGVGREALQGALITVTVFFGLSVLRARDAAETARLLIYLARQAGGHARGGLARCGYRPKGRRARQLFVLQGLPGIGRDRAERLLAHFGSVPAVFMASDEALTAVEGIGPAVAKRIRWVLEAEPAMPERAADPDLAD